jgi:hypothetical protein
MATCMQKFVIAFFLGMAGLSSLRADDILLNGNFTDGKTHWHGDGDSPDTGGRLVITLKPDKWTVVYQNFSFDSSELQLKLTYALSDDCTLAKGSGDKLVTPLTSLGLEEATGMANNIFNVTLPRRTAWMVLLVGGGMMESEEPVFLRRDAKDPRTFITTLSEWNGKFINDALCLAFPPGQGTVTLTDVELLPPSSSP